MEIDVTDYLSHEDIKDIAKEEIRITFKHIFEKDQERLFSNIAYKAVSAMVEDELDGKMKEIIRDNTISVINDLSTYTVFKDKSHYSDKSLGYSILEECVSQNKEIINKRVLQLINELTDCNIKDAIHDATYEFVENNLFKKD